MAFSSASASSTSHSDASSSSSTRSWKYDVFLSFGGEDSGKSFTDHLRKKLNYLKIVTFRDDQEQTSTPALLQAIEESRFSIIVFSQNYASSSRCLDELAKIVGCVHKGKHSAFPVFVHVDPSHVRNQTGSYGEAFEKHEEAYKDDMEKVRMWREALAEASEYPGWDTRNRGEYGVIYEIGRKIFRELDGHFNSLLRRSSLIGIDSQVKKVVSLLSIGSNDIRKVGIWGMGGIGKTTIAHCVYQQINTLFDRCCFLPNVREQSVIQGLDKIKEKLLSSIMNPRNQTTEHSTYRKLFSFGKALIVLDDVDNLNQLEYLVGDRNWFSPGSRIIVTTRDSSLLEVMDMVRYEVGELNKNDALKLFCFHAFRSQLPRREYEGLCHRAVQLTKGIPLAITILGCHLSERPILAWESYLSRMKKSPNMVPLQRVFRISYDGLNDDEKNLFLDIACFFNWEDKDYVSEILESCDFNPQIGIPVLVKRALVTISLNNKLCMHDMIQEMGREIVQEQCIQYPGYRSRLWTSEDVEEVLVTNQGTEAIEGIALDLSASEMLSFHANIFGRMENLRLLRIRVAPMARSWQYLSREDLLASYKLYLMGDFESLSNNLRYLYWHKYPLKSLPSNFYPKELFELNMSFSRLKNLWWEGFKHFPRLKYIDLSHSLELIRIPDLSGAPRLKKINLKGCTSLVEVHPSIGTLEDLSFLILEGCSKLKKLPGSIGKLTSLQTLNLYGCSELKKLPDDMGSSLKTLNLSGCSKLEKLPDSMGSLECLVSLVADGSGIQELPSSINLLTKLQEISLVGCKGGGKYTSRNLFSFLHSSSPRQGLRLPSSLHLVSLRKLKLSDCSLQEGALPTNLSSLYSLEYLDLSRNCFMTLPSLSPLAKLRLLTLEGCASLQSLTGLPASIRTVRAQNCQSLKSFSHLANSYAVWESGELQFDFSNCRQLLEINDDSMEAILRGIRIAAPLPASLSLSKPCRSRNYNAVLAGSSIPEWFIHQIVGNSITIKLPPEFKDTHQSTGLAFCAVLAKNHEKTSQVGRCEYYTWNEFGGFSQYDVAVSAPMHSSEYDHIWFGYASLPQISDHEESDYYSPPIEEGTSDSISGYYRGRKGINHLKVSFVGGDEVAPVVKRCGVRLLQEPDCPNPMVNGEIIEYDTVPASSCLPEQVLFGGHYWKEDLFVGSTSARLGLRIEVEGYHKDVVREGKRWAQAPNPVPAAAALMEGKLDSTATHVKPSWEEVRYILKQHPSFLLTEASNVQCLEAAERLRLFVSNFMEEENARRRSDSDFTISTDHNSLGEDLATSIQKEVYEWVSKLTVDNEALQAQLDQLLAERNNARVSGERDQDGVGCCLCQYGCGRTRGGVAPAVAQIHMKRNTE